MASKAGNTARDLRKIFIAVDFGSSCSGVCWVQSARVSTVHSMSFSNRADKRQPEIQSIIVNWPGLNGVIGGKTRDKVPTELVYRDDTVYWGQQIKDNELRHKWFKLDLCPDANRTSDLVSQYPDDNQLPPEYEHSAAKLSTTYLTLLVEHALSMLELQLGKTIMKTTPREWIVTVPAIVSGTLLAYARRPLVPRQRHIPHLSLPSKTCKLSLTGLLVV